MAVNLTFPQSTLVLEQLKACLYDIVQNSRGLFDTVEAVDKFIRGMMALQEVRYGHNTGKIPRNHRDYHVIVTDTTFNTI